MAGVATSTEPLSSPSANVSRKRKRTPSDADRKPVTSIEPSEVAEEEIIEFLDSNGKTPFTVGKVPRRKKKEQKIEDVTMLQAYFDLPGEYVVKPARIWDSIKKYKKFTLGELSITGGDCIYVKHDQDEADGSVHVLDTEEQWKAMVVEIRAVDGQHVWILVAWMNRPEDMPGGRKPHHGRYELIPTNQMDVIAAETVNGKVSLIHWEDAAKEKPFNDQYFWRQTYDFTYSGKLSPVKPMCVEEQPSNPDALVIQCTNPKCSKWLHWDCVAKSVIERSDQNPPSSSNKIRQFLSFFSSPEAVRPADYTLAGTYTQRERHVDLLTNRRVNEVGSSSEQTTTAVILKDETGKEYRVAMRCLVCDTVID